MTEYKLTIPIKCSTIRTVRNVIEDVIGFSVVAVVLFGIGLLNAIAAHTIFNYNSLGAIIATHGGAIAPYWVAVILSCVAALFTDFLTLVFIQDFCDINVTIDCIREKKSGGD